MIIPEKTEKLNIILNRLQGHKNMPKKDIKQTRKRLLKWTDSLDEPFGIQGSIRTKSLCERT